jgi:hypothetical protein
MIRSMKANLTGLRLLPETSHTWAYGDPAHSVGIYAAAGTPMADILATAAQCDHRDGHFAAHGMIGTVLIALAGEPLTILELTAR